MVNANLDNNGELRENRHRRSRFILPAPRHIVAVAAGAFLAAVLVHGLGYLVMDWFGIGIVVPKSAPMKTDINPSVPEKIVLQADDRTLPTPEPETEPKPDIEIIEEMPPEKIDLEDIVMDNVVIEPGETQISQESISISPMKALDQQMSVESMSSIMKGVPELTPAEPLKRTNSPSAIKTQDPEMINPDEWYNDKLKGAGGQDDSHLPDGSKSLNQLLAQSSLGKDSGYSRLGADLLFEYNKAVMKQSARLSMLQLAMLMMKNPDTIFIVEGHTDSFGSEDYNAVLSLMRANAVRQWLKNNGVPMTAKNGECRLYIRACGASRPVVSVKGDQNAQAANRRVEIHMRKPGEEIPVGCKPVTYVVDMSTPIAQQVQAGIGSRVRIPHSAITSDKKLNSSDKKKNPSATERQNKPSSSQELIPNAEPIQQDIPSAVPVEDDIPLAEPIVQRSFFVERKGVKWI